MYPEYNKILASIKEKAFFEGGNQFFITALSAFACSLSLFSWHSVATGNYSYNSFLFAILFVTVNYLWGVVFIGLTRGRQPLSFSGFLGAILIGSCVVCVFSLSLKAAIPISTIAVLPILLVIALFCIVVLLKTKTIRPHDFSTKNTSFWVLIICLLIASLWSRSLVKPFEIVQESVVFSPWIDYFIHAGTTDIFRYGENVIATGNREMVGLPITFYHYASYMVPAQYSAFTGTDALIAVTSIWFTYGMFLMAVSGYVLINAVEGATAGLGAVVAMTLVPTAASYGFSVGWFDYYWMFLAHPTLLYGISISATAVLFVVQACRSESVKMLFVGFALGLMSLLFKAQIFVVLMPLLFLYSVFFYSPLFRAVRSALIAGGVCAIFFFVFIGSQFSLAPSLRFDGSGLSRYLSNLSHTTTSDFTLWLVSKIGTGLPFWQDLVLGAIVLTGATYGLFFLGYVLLLFHKIYKQNVCVFDWLPAITILIYMCFALLLSPNAHGNPWELQHRPFVWSYFIVAGWVGGRIAYIVQSKMKYSNSKCCFNLMIGFVLTSLLVLSCSSYFTRIHAPLTHSANFNKKIPRGLYDAALYIRDNSFEQDVVQDSKNDEPRAIILGLTERRAYLARPSAHRMSEMKIKEVSLRLGTLKRLQEARNSVELKEVIAETGICWYLLHPDSIVKWPESILTRPVFKSFGYRVYRFNPGAVD